MISSTLDTIAALATPPGEGGLAVIRLSGPRAFEIADAVFRSPKGLIPSSAPSHTVLYGHIVRDQRPIDEVLLTVLRAPRTFTREHTVEISCHSGMLVTRVVLETILASGARLAEPGEFTKRAFLNGRLDLAQAEAVADLIHARTELALDAARSQLAGRLSEAIGAVQTALLNTLAHVEAHLDFPEEDIAPDTHGTLLLRLTEVDQQLENLLKTASEGRILRHGLRIVLQGRPNAGKSSLMNRLLQYDRAIVSPIPGTTRDTVEETTNWDGLPVLLVDTAGLRSTDDPIEAEGVRRSEVAAREAELILYVIDGSEPLHPDDESQLEKTLSPPRLVVLNKSDQPLQVQLPGGRSSLSVSCATGAGLETLRSAIVQLVWSGGRDWKPSSVAISARHADALRRTREANRNAAESLRVNAGLELVAFELRIALKAVGEVVGETTTDDLLDSIFSQFCLGK